MIGTLRVTSQGLSRPFLKTFPAVFPDATDRPWVSFAGSIAIQTKRRMCFWSLFFTAKVNKKMVNIITPNTIQIFFTGGLFLSFHFRNGSASRSLQNIGFT